MVWAGSILGYQAGGFLARKVFAAKIGSIFGGPSGLLLGILAGYTIEYLISYATCSSADNKDEL